MLRHALFAFVIGAATFLTSCANQSAKPEAQVAVAAGSAEQKAEQKTQAWPALEISRNQRFFKTSNNQPFFWLGDTAWLLFKKLDRKEAERYLEIRKQQGFNLVQVMLLHELGVSNYQGTKALVDEDLSQALVSEGHRPAEPSEYDYWDHVDYVVDLAEKKGLWMAMVPIWGTPVQQGKVSVEQAKSYTQFLLARYGNKPNIIWLNGGDTFGNKKTEVWQAIGNTLAKGDHKHLITFHPRGRKMSGEWFHQQSWLDFNMFQSGHRHYHQDIAQDSYRFGPDNWRYVALDYQRKPARPTLDGEPSYEEIPHGLHNPDAPRWQADDLRRYAYWSVFSGAAGFSYGHNSVMQFYRGGEGERAFSALSTWQKALDAPGAAQMRHLKSLMLAHDYFSRVPDQRLVVNQGEKYQYLAATRGQGYALIYSYTGREILVKLGYISGQKVQAKWYDPRSGQYRTIGTFVNSGQRRFNPPGEPGDGNDWVLVLKSL